MKVLDQETRRLILQLHDKGMTVRAIARLVTHSRPTVTRVIESQSDEPNLPGRASMLDKHRTEIVRLIGTCRGNLVRVHEELNEVGVKHSYNTLADYVRKHNLKKPPPEPAGRYHFEPGEEMQFDTSEHSVEFANGWRKCQCASLVLCYSRMWFFRYYPRFRRLECKTFLTEALKHFGGASGKCMIDNTNLVVLHGTGADAVMTPEMVNFGRRFGFVFIAHKIGDANRSGRVERRFDYVENNFLAGRVFADFDDLNTEAAAWCDKVSRRPQERLKAAPVDLFPLDLAAMSPLPPVIPEVYEVVHRIVDVEGYIHLDTNTYSVPYKLIGRQVEIRAGLSQLRAYHGPCEVAVHDRIVDKRGQRITDKKHRPSRSTVGRRSKQPIPEERALREADSLLSVYVDKLQKKVPGRGAATMRRLYRMYNEYPQEAFLAAIREADKYGMLDLSRLENMVLKSLAGRFFPHEAIETVEAEHE
jgi:transposase